MRRLYSQKQSPLLKRPKIKNHPKSHQNLLKRSPLKNRNNLLQITEPKKGLQKRLKKNILKIKTESNRSQKRLNMQNGIKRTLHQTRESRTIRSHRAEVEVSPNKNSNSNKSKIKEILRKKKRSLTLI